MRFLLLVLLAFPLDLLAQTQTVGLFLNTPESYNGYTLFTSSRTSYLIDNCGREVNRWESDYRPGLGQYLTEDGRLIRTGKMPSSVFLGGGVGGIIEIFDWDGTLLWSYQYATDQHHQHHDIAPLPNGNILVLAWELRTAEEATQAGRIAPTDMWPEQVVELMPVGSDSASIVWEWHLWDHLIQEDFPGFDNYGDVSAHPELVNLNFKPNGNHPDWVHANAIAYNPVLDQIAISSRNFSEIWIIDHSTTTEEAAGHTGGNSGKGGDLLYRYGNPAAYQQGGVDDRLFFSQHDVRWVPEGLPFAGQLMVFNNLKTVSQSAVERWMPPVDSLGNYSLEADEAYGPDSLEWSYEAPGFHSTRISGAHPLPNGHVFICEGEDGRFFEIDQMGTIFWEYVNPLVNGMPLNQGDEVTTNATFRATRYGADYPAFIGKDLTPGTIIENDPDPISCIISGTFEEGTWSGVQLLQNPVRDELSIENRTAEAVLVEVFDLMGRSLRRVETRDTQIRLSLAGLPAGMLVLRLRQKDGPGTFVTKVLRVE